MQKKTPHFHTILAAFISGPADHQTLISLPLSALLPEDIQKSLEPGHILCIDHRPYAEGDRVYLLDGGDERSLTRPSCVVNYVDGCCLNVTNPQGEAVTLHSNRFVKLTSIDLNAVVEQDRTGQFTQLMRICDAPLRVGDLVYIATRYQPQHDQRVIPVGSERSIFSINEKGDQVMLESSPFTLVPSFALIRLVPFSSDDLKSVLKQIDSIDNKVNELMLLCSSLKASAQRVAEYHYPVNDFLRRSDARSLASLAPVMFDKNHRISAGMLSMTEQVRQHLLACVERYIAGESTLSIDGLSLPVRKLNHDFEEYAVTFTASADGRTFSYKIKIGMKSGFPSRAESDSVVTFQYHSFSEAERKQIDFYLFDVFEDLYTLSLPLSHGVIRPVDVIKDYQYALERLDTYRDLIASGHHYAHSRPN